MENFDNFETVGGKNFEIIGKKNFEGQIGKKSENCATLPNGRIAKKISWDRVVGDKEEEGGGLVEDQEDQEQVDLDLIINHHQHNYLVVFQHHRFKYQGGVSQVSFEAPEQQKPQVIGLIIITTTTITKHCHNLMIISFNDNTI